MEPRRVPGGRPRFAISVDRATARF